MSFAGAAAGPAASEATVVPRCLPISPLMVIKEGPRPLVGVLLYRVYRVYRARSHSVYLRSLLVCIVERFNVKNTHTHSTNVGYPGTWVPGHPGYLGSKYPGTRDQTRVHSGSGDSGYPPPGTGVLV